MLDSTCTGPSPCIISLDPMLNIGRKKLRTITKQSNPHFYLVFFLETYRRKRRERQMSMAHRRYLHRLRCQAAALLSLKTPTPSIYSPISFKTLEPIQHLSHISSKLGSPGAPPATTLAIFAQTETTMKTRIAKPEGVRMKRKMTMLSLSCSGSIL